MIGTEVQLETNISELPHINRFRAFNDETISSLINELAGKNWNYTSVDVNVVYSDFIENIQEAVDKVAPLKQYEQMKYPWLSTEVKTAQVERDRSYRKFCFTKDEQDWVNYKRKRNKVTAIIKSERKKYFELNIDGCKGDGKKCGVP